MREVLNMRAAIIAALVIFATPAVPAELPRRFFGHWCGPMDSDQMLTKDDGTSEFDAVPGMRRVSEPCKVSGEIVSVTITGNRVVKRTQGGLTRCVITEATVYKARKPFLNTYLACLACNKAQENGTFWFELIDGKLHHLRSGRLLCE
jgi:hypothetical protein